MSKYNKQNRLDEKAISIVSDYFMNKHGDKFDLQFHGIKDNTPDTDGFLRLREPEDGTPLAGKYLNHVVFFQLKGFENFRSPRQLNSNTPNAGHPGANKVYKHSQCLLY